MNENAPNLTRFIPGPSWVHPDVLAAQARAVYGHREALTADLHLHCEARLKKIFQTDSRVVISSSSGSGLMEAGIRSLVHRRSLHLVCGSFSKRWQQMATACGKEPVTLEVPAGQGFFAQLLDEHLSGAEPYEAVFLTHNETSTGIVNPIEELIEVIRKHGDALICVDAVSSMSGVSIPVDTLGIDYCLTSSQKCFSLPPGLAFASVSPRAFEKAGQVEGRGWYLDLLNLEKYAGKGHYPSTPAITLMYALDAQLDRIEAEGIEARFARHSRMADQVRTWGEEHLELFAPAGYRSETLTTVTNKKKAGGEVEFAQLAAFLKSRGFTIANGYGDLKNLTFRIAHMGDIPQEKLDELLGHMTEFLNS